MTYKTFNQLMVTAVAAFHSNSERDRILTEAFGDDTTIHTDYCTPIICNILTAIRLEYGDSNIDMVDWLIYEVLLDESNLTFCIDDICYEGTCKNIWLLLEGSLSEQFSIKSEE